MKRVEKLNEHIKSSEQALEEQRRLRAELQVIEHLELLEGVR